MFGARLTLGEVQLSFGAICFSCNFSNRKGPQQKFGEMELAFQPFFPAICPALERTETLIFNIDFFSPQTI